ncbi:MAG: hypothetical protein ABR517_14910 [Thermoanaerobaculia bacterium]
MLLTALLCFSAATVLSWSSAIPIGRAPDEEAHLEVAVFEARHGRIPEFGVDDAGAFIYETADGRRTPYLTYSAQPGLAYPISAAAIRLTGAEERSAGRVARLPGVLYAMLFVALVFAAARAALPHRPYVPFLAAVLAAGWPQLTFIFSYMNNDGLTIVGSSALVWSWYVAIRRGWRTADVVRTGVLAGFVLLNKPHGYVFVAAAFFLMATTGSGGAAAAARRLAAGGATAMAVSGWWFLLAVSRYGSDIFAERRARELISGLGVDFSSGKVYGFSMWDLLTRPFPRYDGYWIAGTLKSTVGVFEDMNVPLPQAIYGAFALLVLLAAVGWWAGRSRVNSADWWQIRLAHVVTGSLLPLLLLLSLYRSWSLDFQAQGRYLLPAAVPLLIGIAGGLSGFAVAAGAARGWRVVCLFAAIFLEIHALAFWGTIVPTYSSPAEWIGEHPVLSFLWIASMAAALGLLAVIGRRGRLLGPVRARREEKMAEPE